MSLTPREATQLLRKIAQKIPNPLPDPASLASSEDLARLALSLSKAGRHEEAIPFLQASIEKMSTYEPELRNALAHAWAIALYVTSRGTELREFAFDSDLDLSPSTRARVLLKLAWYELVARNEEGYEQAVAAAQDTCSPDAHQIILAECKYLNASYYVKFPGDLHAADHDIQLACSIFRMLDERQLLGRALELYAIIEWNLGRARYALDLIQEAMEIAASLGDFRSTTLVIRQLGIFTYHQADFSTSQEALDAVIELAEDIGFLNSLESSKTKFVRCRIYLMMQQAPVALQLLNEVRDDVEKMDGVDRSIWFEYHGIAQFQMLDYVAALESFDQAERELKKAGIETYELAEVYWHQAEVHLAMHNPRVALDLTENALKVVRQCGNERELGQILRVKATALAQLGQMEESIVLFDEAIEELRRRNYQYELAVALTRLAETLDEDAQRAIEAANEAIAIFNRIGLSELVSDAMHARDTARLKLQVVQRIEERNRISQQDGFIIAESRQMKELLQDCQLIARSSAPVVISGETGVGKEVVARYIHEHSNQAEGPFVAINCAALPESLFERELFGHKKGAFTGADRDSIGLVTFATHGTLFFDEVGELPLPLQAKLLRLLQDGTYRRVGDVTEYHAEVRVLAATNRDLEDLVEKNNFREDLWYRLNAFDLRIPPLRERTEDIAPLTDLFLEQESQKAGIEFWMDQASRQLFENYGWPGNVRELESAVRAGATRAIENGCIKVEHLPRALRQWKSRKKPAILSLEKHLEVEERRIILHALRQCNNSRTEAARFLGIGRNTLYEKMERLGIVISKEATA